MKPLDGARSDKTRFMETIEAHLAQLTTAHER